MARTARRNTIVYLPMSPRLSQEDNIGAIDTTERWEIVKGALIDNGFTNLRPAPMPSLAFVPRSLRNAAGSPGRG